jgi:hypothetical protein
VINPLSKSTMATSTCMFMGREYDTEAFHEEVAEWAKHMIPLPEGVDLAEPRIKRSKPRCDCCSEFLQSFGIDWSILFSVGRHAGYAKILRRGRLECIYHRFGERD